jgi:integrase
MSPRKRGQNEGSIYKRKGGRWCAQISVQGKRVTNYFDTQREGLDWLQEMRNQINAGLTLDGAQKSLSDFLEQWLGSIRLSVRPMTLSQYRQIVRMHIIPMLGSIKLKDLRPDQIQTLYNQKLDSGTSARTVLLIHAVLHRSLKQAFKWGIIGRNPASVVTRPKVVRKEMMTLNDNQVRTLILIAKGTRYEVLFWLAVTTGMRQGELLGLRWSDLDWRSKKLHVQRQLQRTSAGQIFSEPKSAAGRRVIMLGDETIKKLRAHLGVLSQERQIAGEQWQENDLIFPSTKGTPWDQRNMYKYYKRFLRKAGLPDIRFHDLRHTAATLMLQQGVHPKVVQERLGHADITLTLNTYSHVLPVMQEEAAERLDQLLTPIDVSNELKKVDELQADYVPASL